MPTKQLAVVLAVIIICFAAVAVVGWISDRTAQESNDQAISRLQSDLNGVRDGVGEVRDSVEELKKTTDEASAASGETAAQLADRLVAVVDRLIYVESAIVGMESSIDAGAGERDRLLRQLNGDVVDSLDEIFSAVYSPEPAYFCTELRSLQEGYIEDFNSARNVYIQQIHQSRLSTLAIVAAVLDCNYLLYP